MIANSLRLILVLQLALLIIAVSAFWPTSAEAKLFRNSYVSFDLPDRWDCHLEGTEWICNSLLKDDSREAIIILTAKEVAPADTLEAYEAKLKTPHAIPTAKGKPVQSEVKQIKRRNIGNHPWVDATHLSSEIPNYYTRYLATVKDRIAILVTFSAHQKSYTKYSSDFFKAVESLQVVASSDALKPSTQEAIRPGAETLGAPMAGVADPNDPGVEDIPKEPTGSRDNEKYIGLALAIAAIGGYIYLKKRKK